MILAVFLASNTVGALPILVVLIVSAASNPSVAASFSANPNDLSLLGISPNLGLILQLFPFLVALVVLIFLVKPLNQRSIGSVINGNAPFRYSRFFMSAGIWIIVSALYLVINMKADPSNFSVNNKTATLIPLIIITLLMIPFQAAFEEILFRGYLLQGFTVLARNKLLPLITTSILFGLMHGINPEVKEFGFWTMLPQYVFFGLIFGIITILDDGVEAAIGAHAANNIFLCIMLTNESSALQAPSLFIQHKIYPKTDFGAMILMGIIVLTVMSRVFKWKNLSSIFGKVEKGETVQIP